jgi:hypothetical protein
LERKCWLLSSNQFNSFHHTQCLRLIAIEKSVMLYMTYNSW